LLVAVHRIHGVTSSAIIGAIPIDAPYLIVRNCTFNGRGTMPIPFTHRGESECTKEDGIFGQGKNNPQFTFSDHALVEHSTGIFDPSYGVGPDQNLKTWEDKGIAGLGTKPYVDMTYGKDLHIIPLMCSPGFIKYSAKVGDTMASIAMKYGVTPANALENHRYNKSPGKPAVTAKPGEIILIPREIAKLVTILKKIAVSQNR
jgi:hypothetical protein